MRTRCVKSNLAALCGEARYEADLIAITRTIDQLLADGWKHLDVAQASEPRQCIGNHPALPRELRFVAKVKGLAPAALREDRAHGLDPVGRPLQDLDRMGADVVLLDGVDRHTRRFTRQSTGYKRNKSIGTADSLPVGQQIIDVDWCACEIDGRRITRGVVRQGS